VVEHYCRDEWVSGTVSSCQHHMQQRVVPDIRPYNDERTRLRTEGIAKSGQVSKQGTVTHKDFWSGKLAVMARPATLFVKGSEQPAFTKKWAWRNGRWIHRATGTELEWQTTVGNTAYSGSIT
jgi:hypothetical protein